MQPYSGIHSSLLLLLVSIATLVLSQHTPECFNMMKNAVCVANFTEPPDCPSPTSKLEMCAEEKVKVAQQICPYLVDYFGYIVDGTRRAVATYCNDCKFYEGFNTKPECWAFAATCAIGGNSIPPTPDGKPPGCGGFVTLIKGCQNNVTTNCAPLLEAYFEHVFKDNHCLSQVPPVSPSGTAYKSLTCTDTTSAPVTVDPSHAVGSSAVATTASLAVVFVCLISVVTLPLRKL